MAPSAKNAETPPSVATTGEPKSKKRHFELLDPEEAEIQCQQGASVIDLSAGNVPRILESIFSPLAYESSNTCLEVVRCSLESFKVNGLPLFNGEILKDEEKLKQLWNAAKSGDADQVLLFLSEMVDQKCISKSDDYGIRSPTTERKKASALDVDYHLSTLYVASSRGHEDIVQAILNAGTDPNEGGTNVVNTPMHKAVAEGHMEVVRLLLDRGAKPNKADQWRQTPLHYAATNGQKDIVQILLEKGARVDRADKWGQTPLYFAARKGHKNVMEILLDRGAKADKQDTWEQTPLYEAAIRGHTDAVQLLLDRGADHDMADWYGRTPLFCAAMEGHRDVVRILLNGGADKNTADQREWTPLHAAAKWNHQGVVQMLLDGGVDPNVADQDGRTSLHVAARLRRQDVVRKLLSGGADPTKKTTDKLEDSPLSISKHIGFRDIASILQGTEDHTMEEDDHAKEKEALSL